MEGLEGAFRNVPVPFVQAASQSPNVTDSITNPEGAGKADRELEKRLEEVKERLADPQYRSFLDNLECLGTLHDMSRYGVVPVEDYLRNWQILHPPVLQSPSPTRETTFPSNLDYQFDGKGYQRLLRRTPGAGLGYREMAGDGATESSSKHKELQIDRDKVQFDFAQTTPHKKRVKHRNIMGDDGQVVDVTGMEEGEIRAALE